MPSASLSESEMGICRATSTGQGVDEAPRPFVNLVQSGFLVAAECLAPIDFLAAIFAVGGLLFWGLHREAKESSAYALS